MEDSLSIYAAPEILHETEEVHYDGNEGTADFSYDTIQHFEGTETHGTYLFI